MKPRKTFWLLSLAALWLAILSAPGIAAADPAEIGVVVMHGKWDKPDGYTSGLVSYLAREGFPVVGPEMPWSGSRAYDKGAAGLLAELDAAVEKLKAKGARKIVLVGQSQGATAALYYATQRAVAGVALVAPGGAPQSKLFSERYADSVAEAKRLIAQGKPQEPVSFTDLNTGNRSRPLRAPARVVADYFDPEGPMNSFANAARIKPGTAVLWVDPSRDAEGTKRVASTTYEKLPDGTRRQRVEVEADHLGAPDVAKSLIADWLRGL